MVIEQNVAIVCWMLFVVYWLINIPLQKKAAIKFRVREHLKYRFLSALAGLLLVVPIIVMFNRPDIYYYHHSVITQAFSIIFSVSGVVICIFARRSLAGNWSAGFFRFKRAARACYIGAVSICAQNAIYTGFLLMYAGIALAFFSWIGLLGILVFFWGALRKDKKRRSITAPPPTEYAEY